MCLCYSALSDLSQKTMYSTHRIVSFLSTASAIINTWFRDQNIINRIATAKAFDKITLLLCLSLLHCRSHLLKSFCILRRHINAHAYTFYPHLTLTHTDIFRSMRLSLVFVLVNFHQTHIEPAKIFSFQSVQCKYVLTTKRYLCYGFRNKGKSMLW